MGTFLTIVSSYLVIGVLVLIKELIYHYTLGEDFKLEHIGPAIGIMLLWPVSLIISLVEWIQDLRRRNPVLIPGNKSAKVFKALSKED